MFWIVNLALNVDLYAVFVADITISMAGLSINYVDMLLIVMVFALVYVNVSLSIVFE